MLSAPAGWHKFSGTRRVQGGSCEPEIYPLSQCHPRKISSQSLAPPSVCHLSLARNTPINQTSNFSFCPTIISSSPSKSKKSIGYSSPCLNHHSSLVVLTGEHSRGCWRIAGSSLWQYFFQPPRRKNLGHIRGGFTCNALVALARQSSLLEMSLQSALPLFLPHESCADAYLILQSPRNFQDGFRRRPDQEVEECLLLLHVSGPIYARFFSCILTTFVLAATL